MLKYSYFILICALTAVDIILLVFSLRNKEKKAVKGFIMMSVLIIIAHVFYGASLVITNVRIKLFVHELKFLGIVYFSSAFYIMYMQLFDKHNMLRRRFITLILIVPSLSVLLAVTNDYHHLFRLGLYVVENPYGSFIGVQSGPLFWPYIIYTYVVFFSVIIIVIKAYLKTPKLYRMQLGIMVIAAIATLTINFISISGIFFEDFGDATLISFTFAATIQFYGLVLYKPAGMIRMARGLAVSEIKDPFVAFDYRNAFLGANAAAHGMFELKSGMQRRDFLTGRLGLPEMSADTAEALFEKDGLSFSVKMKKIYDEDGTVALSVILLSDITEIKRRESELESMANFDFLTGIANRHSYLHELKQLSDSDLPVSIVHFNICGMKEINRQLGNEAGDEVIKRVAGVLAGVRWFGFCARLGGDEFALILKNTAKDEAESVISEAERSLADIKLASGLAVKQSNLDNINIIDKLSMDNMYTNKLVNNSGAMGRKE